MPYSMEPQTSPRSLNLLMALARPEVGKGTGETGPNSVPLPEAAGAALFYHTHAIGQPTKLISPVSECFPNISKGPLSVLLPVPAPLL